MRFRNIVHGGGIVAACALLAGEGGLTAAFSPSNRDPIPVHVEIVAPERSRPTLIVQGVVEAKSTRTLRFRTSGRIARFYVEPGAPVAMGQAIAEFDRAQLEAQQRSARTNLARAQARLLASARREGRRRQLLDLVAAAAAPVARPSIESLLNEAEVRYAHALLERARSRLAAGVLRAPANGVVDRRYRGVGDVALAGAPVVRLNELDVVVTRASLPRALQPLLHVGGAAEVRVGDAAASPLPGVIVSVERGAAVAGNEVEFEVRVENPALALRPGMLVSVAIAVDAPAASYTLPLLAVRRGIDARPFSFVVVEHGAELRVERRSLVLGGFDGARVAVVAGLEAGDRVVTHGQDLVTVGDAVGIVGEGR